MELPGHSRPFVAIPATPIEPHPISVPYRLGLLAVAVGLLLLPVLYFALVAAIAWAVYWHVRNVDWYMEHLRGLLGLTVFIAPILTGVALVFFMSRPFFSRSEKPRDMIVITPETEPVLFEFIRAISELVRAPFPTRVYVDWQVNASASLHRGFRSLFNRELDLTLGLPLVSAFTVSQLAGVVAHEFGHFAQGTGMRFSYLIRAINRWLARVAYQPDDLEETLAQSGFNRNLWGSIALGTTRFGIWVARWVLHGLTMLGHTISCFSLRQMEFDADLYEAKVSGPEAFTAVIKQLRFLDAGWNAANYLIMGAWENKRLARDLSALTLARTKAVAEYQKRDLEKEAARERSGWFRTHPSERERIEHVHRGAISPAFIDPRPASELFRDFTALSETVTLHYYRLLGLPLEDAKFCDVEEICEGRALGPIKLAAVQAFFADRFSPVRPILFAADELAGRLSGNTPQLRIRENRAAWEKALSETQEAFEKFQSARARLVACEQASWLKDAGVRFTPSDYGFERRSRREIALIRAEAAAVLAELEPDLLQFESIAQRRLIDALRVPVATGLIKDSITELALTLESFRPILDLLPKLRNNFAVYVALYPQKKSQSPRHRAHTLRLELSQTLNHQLRALNPFLRGLTLPYGNRESVLTILQRRLPDDPLPFEATIYRDTSVYLEEIDVAYFRIIGDLCIVAQNAEATVVREEWIESPGVAVNSARPGA